MSRKRKAARQVRRWNQVMRKMWVGHRGWHGRWSEEGGYRLRSAEAGYLDPDDSDWCPF
jgi:hypothetical protein